jgi:basic membrane protein A and related proteins
VPNRRSIHLVTVLLVAAAAVLAGCGSSSSSSGGGGSSSGSSSGAKKIKVGLVTDVGGLNDRGFNELAYDGLKRAHSQLGVPIRVLQSTKNSDYIPNLSALAQQGYALVIGNGFLMADAMDTVATKFPSRKFAIIDYDAGALKHKPKNVTGLLFKEQEAGYLVGYMAGLYMKDHGGSNPTISSVGGEKSAPVDHYIAGYQAGAKAADPSVKTLNDYSQTFIEPDKCKELALNQIQQGAKVVFQVAGQCGLGALDAAKEKGVQAIGVDKDQSYLGPQVMTSALKKVDLAVFDTVKAAQAGSFKAGADTTFDLKSGGVGIGKTNSVGAKYVAKVKAVQKKIVSGQISNIPSTVK